MYEAEWQLHDGFGDVPEFRDREYRLDDLRLA